MAKARRRGIISAARCALLLQLAIGPQLVASARAQSARSEVSLSGSYRQAAGRSAWAAALGVTFPWDAMLRPRMIAHQQSPDEQPAVASEANDDSPTASENPGSELDEEREPESELDSETPGTTEAEPRPPAIVVTPALAQRLVQVALRVAGVPREAAALRSLRSRARSSAALPEVRLRAGHSSDESLRLAPTLDDPSRYTQTGGADLWFEGRLTWRLDRLIFNTDELAVERLRLRRELARAKIVREVLELLFDWQQQQLLAADESLTVRARLKARLGAIEAAATLDILTAGWFSEQMAPPAVEPRAEPGKTSVSSDSGLAEPPPKE